MHSLNKTEIKTLLHQGCSCDNWDLIKCHKQSLSKIYHTKLIGSVFIGKLDNQTISYRTKDQTIKKKPIIEKALLENCSIGNNCYISNVTGGIKGMTIEKECLLENIASLQTTTQSQFGHNTLVPILSQLQTHQVPIFNGLSAQLAYLLAFSKGDEGFTQKLKTLLSKKIKPPKNGFIGHNAVIRYCGDLIDICIESHAEISFVNKLINGYISSNEKTQTLISNNVSCNNFIIEKGNCLENNVSIENTFIGESCQIKNHCFVKNSLFFSCCDFEKSEIEGLFAAPHTVSHHRSTLLISAYMSHFNAGSSTNASNHLYKLGPHSWGYFQRGVKTASNAYLLYPAKIGLFSIVIGKIKTHIDTTAFPFSIIIGKEKATFLYPAKTLESIGLYRDLKKWQQKQKNKDLTLDLIENKMNHPYTISRIYEASKRTSKRSFKQFKIKKKWYQKAKKIYLNYTKRYLIEKWLFFLQQKTPILNLKKQFKPNLSINWIDLGGYYTSKQTLNKALEETIQQKDTCFSKNLEKTEIENSLLEMNWVVTCFKSIYHEYPWNYSVKKNKKLLDEWETLEKDYYQKLILDAKKEFDVSQKICYGVLVNQENEFKAIKGSFKEHPLIKEIEKKIEKIPTIKRNYLKLLVKKNFK